MTGQRLNLNQLVNTQILAAEDKSYNQMFRSRLLDQRSRLEFHYPGKTAQGGEMIIFIPFYENPKITETQTANYAEYNPVGRAGSLYAYTGAKSRKIKVKMTFTLPHLAMHDMGIDRFMRVFKGASKDSQKLLFTQFANYSNEPLGGDAIKSLALAVEKEYLNLRVENGYDISEAILNSPTKFLENITPNERHKVIDTLLFFVTLIRTSIANKATDPMNGPPLVRLNFGTMYQSIPCICKNYDISWEEGGGYDLGTLTPRRLNINLQLDEVRVGDFSKYDPAKFTKRDNLAGWESAVGGVHTIDPLPLGRLGD
jgi:hypothetical protein